MSDGNTSCYGEFVNHNKNINKSMHMPRRDFYPSLSFNRSIYCFEINVLKFIIGNMPLNKNCIFARSRSERKKGSHENPSQYKRLTEGQLRVAGIQQTMISSYACSHHINHKCNEKFCCCPTSDHSKY